MLARVPLLLAAAPPGVIGSGSTGASAERRKKTRFARVDARLKFSPFQTSWAIWRKTCTLGEKSVACDLLTLY
jgi:hypothetical protein